MTKQPRWTRTAIATGIAASGVGGLLVVLTSVVDHMDLPTSSAAEVVWTPRHSPTPRVPSPLVGTRSAVPATRVSAGESPDSRTLRAASRPHRTRDRDLVLRARPGPRVHAGSTLRAIDWAIVDGDPLRWSGRAPGRMGTVVKATPLGIGLRPVDRRVRSSAEASDVVVRRGWIGAVVSGRRHSGLSLIDRIGAEMDGLGDMAQATTVGTSDVLPLPKGEPGGRIIGRGKDIKGVFRLVRVKHDLADWWADAPALNTLAKWLNEKTQIRTDMNVDGGAVALTDSGLLKSPLLWMTGHDPSLIQSHRLLSHAAGARLRNHLIPLEVANLRRYLIDKQGLLVFDDCGVNAPAQAMSRIFLTQMRLVMPEYGVQHLRNDHPLYRVYYELGGPPIGFDVFWWGTHSPKRNYLEGISIRDKLVALLGRFDIRWTM